MCITNISNIENSLSLCFLYSSLFISSLFLVFALLALLGAGHIITQGLLAVLLATIVLNEVCQLRDLLGSYFLSFMNLFDIAFAFMLLYLLARPDNDIGTARAFSRIYFWVRGILLVRVFDSMSALLFMVFEILIDTIPSMALLSMFTLTIAHGYVFSNFCSNFWLVFDKL